MNDKQSYDSSDEDDEVQGANFARIDKNHLILEQDPKIYQASK